MAYPDFNADKPSAKKKGKKSHEKKTMIICGILYYVSFKGATWGTLRQYFSSLRAAIARA